MLYKIILMLSLSIAFQIDLYCYDLNPKEIKIYFQNLHRLDMPESDVSPVYKLNFDTLGVAIDKNPENDVFYPLVLPSDFNSPDTSFFKLYFEGSEYKLLDRSVAVLVGNIKSDMAKLWVDHNCNFNFSDDGPPLNFSKETPAYVNLLNSYIHGGKFTYKIRKAIWVSEEIKERTVNYFYNDGSEGGFITIEPENWVSDTRLNILSCDTIIDGKNVQIGLMDWSCNGVYDDIDSVSEDNFSSDRILVGEYGSEYISTEPSDGAVSLLKETYITINRKVYKLKEIEPTGKYIVITETNKEVTTLAVGDALPNLPYETLDGESTSINNEIQYGKLNLINIWATWCNGCSISAEKLKKFDSLYSHKLNIINLHHFSRSDDQIEKFNKKYDIKRKQGLLNAEISSKLLASGGIPYYVLLDGEGKIKKFNIYLDELEEILKE